MNKIRAWSSVATVLMAIGVASQASAQSIDALGPLNIFSNYNRGRNTSVVQRERPEYDPIGILYGGFTVLPSLETGLDYNSNVLATKTNESSDGAFVFTPDVDAHSNWSRNSLQGSIGANLLEYFSKSDESQENWHANVIGRYDLVGDSYFTGGGEVRRDYLDQSNISFPDNAAEPIPVTTSDVFGRGVYQGGRVRLSGVVSFENQTYDSVKAIGGGRLDQSSRDVDVTSVAGRSDYAISPDSAVFGSAQYFDYDYTNTGVFNRNSTQYIINGGFNFDISALARGEISLGYESKTYSDPTFKSISGLAASGKVEYFPTELTTVTGTVSRSIQDSILGSTGGYTATVGGLQVDHELLRNFLLNVEASYEQDDFAGVDRTDHFYTVGGGGKYMLNRNLALKANLTYESRQSDGPAAGREYDIFRAMFTIVLGL